MDQLILFKGMKEVMLELKQQGYSLGLLSSNTQANINKFLINHQLEIFDFIETSSLFNGKVGKLNRILSQSQRKPNEVIYIGDEVRDIKACQKAGIPIIVVTWGYQKEALLKKYSPDYIVSKPSDIIKIINTLQTTI